LNPAIPLLLTVAISAGGAADGHLLAGARHFADARYEHALVEFQVAQRLGCAEGAAYAGATLVELERWEDAVEAFGAAPPPGADSLLDYYRARACYGARLYFCADAILAGLGNRSGPRIAAHAAKMRAALAVELARQPSRAAIEWYAARCASSRAQGRVTLADAYSREAAPLRDVRARSARVSEAAVKAPKTAPAARGVAR
jgi:hypothetical protein